MVFQGAVLIRRGQVEKGLALHDEGMVMAVGGDLSQLATVQIVCQVIRTCYELGDYRRAQESAPRCCWPLRWTAPANPRRLATS